MPSITAKDANIVETQSPPPTHTNAHKTVLREHRLHQYLGEPISDGNRLVMLSSPSTSASYQNTATMAGSDMETKMESVMKPFQGAGGNH